jgi:hypothetical protein
MNTKLIKLILGVPTRGASQIYIYFKASSQQIVKFPLQNQKHQRIWQTYNSMLYFKEASNMQLGIW